jgi:hypothetical protein
MSDDTPLKRASTALSDAANAAKKIANTVETAIAFLQKIVAPPVEQLSGMFTDQLQFWRARNLNRIAGKYDELVRERAWHPDAIKMLPFGLSVRVFEKASSEEDDTIQSMWARLLLNATDPAKGIDISKIHIDILSSITSVDAFILDLAWSWNKTRIPAFGFGTGEAREQYVRRVAERGKMINDQNKHLMNLITKKTLPVSLYNLLRLKLFDQKLRPLNIIGQPSWSLKRNIGFGTDKLDFDFDELGRILDKLVDSANTQIDLDELCGRFFEKEEDCTPVALCENVIAAFTFTALGQDFMNSIDVVHQSA